MDKELRRHSEPLKRAVVDEIESGRMNLTDASREYGIPKYALKDWLTQFGRFKPQRSIVEVVMKSEKERIAELEKALAEAHLKNRVYDEIIKEAGRRYKVDLKKSFGPASSGSSGETDSKSKRSVKR